MGTISKNFSYREFEESEMADKYDICNVISASEARDNIKALVDDILQPLRDAWGKPLSINSGYRSPEVNRLVGGVPSSQHVLGEAADVCPFGRNGKGDFGIIESLARLVVDLGLPFDQLIVYPTFVHISHRRGRDRKQFIYNRRCNK